MNTVEQGVEIKRRAKALGFAATGIARLDRNPHAAELDHWLAKGHGGTMAYLNRQAEKRKDPRKIFADARSAVVTLTDYFHGSPTGAGARVAQYAWSSDYHDVLGQRLEQLAAVIRLLAPGSKTRCYVDARSEEHTSELQSHSDLVCRLLLEKKNKAKTPGRKS